MLAEHSHDVSILWMVYPFNIILWQPVVAFLHGHGLNLLNNFLYWIFGIPISVWNSIVPYFFMIFNVFMFALNLLPNVFFGLISAFFFWPFDILYFMWNALTSWTILPVAGLISVLGPILASIFYHLQDPHSVQQQHQQHKHKQVQILEDYAMAPSFD